MPKSPSIMDQVSHQIQNEITKQGFESILYYHYDNHKWATIRIQTTNPSGFIRVVTICDVSNTGEVEWKELPEWLNLNLEGISQ